MDLRSIIITNGIGVVLMLMLEYVSRAKILRRTKEDRIYSLMVLGVLAGCFVEVAAYLLDGRVFPGARILNYAANTYLFTVNLLLPFSVLVYVDLGLYGDMDRIRKVYRPQILVGAVMLAVTAVNLFVPVVFRISEQNVYERLPLTYVYYLVILYYLLTSLFLTWRYERENGTRSFFRVGLFILPILVGAGLQFRFYGLSLAWISAAVGLTGLFMMQQNELAFIDPLVDTYNRQYLNHTLSAWISRGLPFAGAMLDIDRFKSINDGFGHSEGDNALKTLTGILRRSRIGRERVFRFAGDEFIVLKDTGSEESMAEYMAAVERNLEAYNREGHPYPLEISYGISLYGPDGVDAFMREMDERLYEMKAEHHKRR